MRMLNWLWAGMVLVSLIAGAVNGRLNDVTNAMLSGGGQGAENIGRLIARLLHQAALHPALGVHKQDLAAGVLFLKNLGHRQGRIHMAGGAAAGKDHFHTLTPHSALGATICRDTLRITPIEASWMSSAVPP